MAIMATMAVMAMPMPMAMAIMAMPMSILAMAMAIMAMPMSILAMLMSILAMPMSMGTGSQALHFSLRNAFFPASGRAVAIRAALPQASGEATHRPPTGPSTRCTGSARLLAIADGYDETDQPRPKASNRVACLHIRPHRTPQRTP